MTNADTEAEGTIREEVEKILSDSGSCELLEVLMIDPKELRQNPKETMYKLTQRMIGFGAGIKLLLDRHSHRGK